MICISYRIDLDDPTPEFNLINNYIDLNYTEGRAEDYLFLVDTIDNTGIAIQRSIIFLYLETYSLNHNLIYYLGFFFRAMHTLNCLGTVAFCMKTFYKRFFHRTYE